TPAGVDIMAGLVGVQVQVPLVQRQAAAAERVGEGLVGAGDKTVQRHRHVGSRESHALQTCWDRRTHRRITGREPEAGRSDDSATRAAEEGSVCSSRRTPRSGRSAASPCTPVYRPHSTLIAGIVVLAAGLYEHTPPPSGNASAGAAASTSAPARVRAKLRGFSLGLI